MKTLLRIGFTAVLICLIFTGLVACQKDTVTPIQSKTNIKHTTTAVKSLNLNKKASDPTKITAGNDQSATVTVSVVGLNNASIISPTKVPCKKGETFIQATLDIVKKKNMQITVKYSGNYVSSIDNLSERQHGPMSGWIAKLNGVKLTKGVGVTNVSPGDRLEWVYSTTGE